MNSDTRSAGRSTVSAGGTRYGVRAAEILSHHVSDLAKQLPLTTSQEQAVLSGLGMTALASKGDKRIENLHRGLDNAIAGRAFSVENSVSLTPWQQALDWNTSLVINESKLADPEGRLVYDYTSLLNLWRSTSPLTLDGDGNAPQREFQTSSSPVVSVIAQKVQNFLASQDISEITLHKAMKWENDVPADAGDMSIPMSERRPDWFRAPGPDMRDDLFDEGASKTPLGAGSVLLSRYTGFTLDKEQAVQIGRWSDAGEPSRFYAVVSATFPVESVVSIPSLGFSSLSRMEVVVDRSSLSSGTFSVVFGQKV